MEKEVNLMTEVNNGYNSSERDRVKQWAKGMLAINAQYPPEVPIELREEHREKALEIIEGIIDQHPDNPDIVEVSGVKLKKALDINENRDPKLETVVSLHQLLHPDSQRHVEEGKATVIFVRGQTQPITIEH